jgi:uncharacterized coiled-coil protein SlyX
MVMTHPVDLTMILQIIAILAAGAGFVIFIDKKINGLEFRMFKKLNGIGEHVTEVKQAVAVQEVILSNQKERLDRFENKLGEMAQKAQIILSSRDLAKGASSGN